MKTLLLAFVLISSVAMATNTPAPTHSRRCCSVILPPSDHAPITALATSTCCEVALVSATSEPAPAQQANKNTDPEALPPAPKSDPKSVHIEAPNLKGVIMEVRPDKTRRLLISTEVCLREGALEVLLCKKGTKEHEAILRVDVDAQKIHELLLLAGAEAGKPTQFVDPKTEMQSYKPATGTKINMSVHYTKDGKTFTHPVQDWVWDNKKKASIAHHWVFAGSIIITDPDNGKKFYAANSGDIISISNFPFSMLEIPSEITKDDAQLTFEAKTDKIPAIGSKVWLILDPASATK
ncbi:MAG: hypothetical protein C0467_11270 [Planctomycetaceae bacterium]|nr:hypothetical protein [Planctomycetaceae bacterium]